MKFQLLIRTKTLNNLSSPKCSKMSYGWNLYLSYAIKDQKKIKISRFEHFLFILKSSYFRHLHINPSLVLVQHRNTRPYITERLLMGRKESNQTKQTKTLVIQRTHMYIVMNATLADFKPQKNVIFVVVFRLK